MNMWNQFLLQRGFRNVIRDGRVAAFQFKMTMPYYRGLWVSAAFRDFAVRVDGVVYPKDKITLKIGGNLIPLTQADEHNEDFWRFGDPATIIIDRPGGLSMGRHKVEVGIRYDRSYASPATPPPGYQFEGAAGFGAVGAFGRTPLQSQGGTGMQPQGGTGTPSFGGMRGDPIFAGFPNACSLDMVLVI